MAPAAATGRSIARHSAAGARRPSVSRAGVSRDPSPATPGVSVATAGRRTAAGPAPPAAKTDGAGGAGSAPATGFISDERAATA